MANNNIVAKNITISTSSGVKTYYNMVLINEDTGQIKSAINITSLAEAKAYLEEAKKEDSGVRINGTPNADPFEDGTFSIQETYDVEIEKSENKESNIDMQLGNEVAQPGHVYSNDPGSYNTFDQFNPAANTSSPGVGQNSLSPSSTFNNSLFEKKARDLSGLPEEKRKQYEGLTEEQKAEKNVNGVFGSKRIQARVKRENTPSELVVGRGPDNNAFIVIGNDRFSKPHTGYGGKGHTQCDSIDLVAGLGGHSPREVEKVSTANGEMVESQIKTNPNFFLDSARVYISQKIDVDKSFGIGEFGLAESDLKDDTNDKETGKYGAKSAIVTKADNIRIIGRESIRIVTGTDKFNSQGGEVLGRGGIEIIAMNDTKKLQPMVLGENLIELLDTMVSQIEALANICHAANKYQMKMNEAMQQHTHLSPFFALPTTQSPQAIAGGSLWNIENMTKSELSTLKQATNLQGIRHNYLTESGKKFINSRLNKVN